MAKKTEVTYQFAGKSYTQDEFVKTAKEIWKTELKRKATEMTSLELYVKPEECKVYYVFNETECGSFEI